MLCLSVIILDKIFLNWKLSQELEIFKSKFKVMKDYGKPVHFFVYV
jgi:hypothetical protein